MDKSESKLGAVVTHTLLTLIWLENFLINGFCFYPGKKKSFVLHSSNLNPDLEMEYMKWKTKNKYCMLYICNSLFCTTVFSN